MKRPGTITLIRFPQTDLAAGRLRPALILAKIPGPYDDWLICMISSRLRQHAEPLDEIVDTEDSDFARSGLKVRSVFRVGRLAVVEESLLEGVLGEISSDRLRRIRERLATWLRDES